MATIVEDAFGTEDEILSQLQSTSPSVVIESYDGVAATTSDSDGSTAPSPVFSDSMDVAPSVETSLGSLLVTSVGAATGPGQRMGSLNVLSGGPIDLTSSPAIRVWVKFDAAALAVMSLGGNANAVRLFSNVPANSNFAWLFQQADVASGNWTQLVLPFSSATQANSPVRSAITHIDVAWGAAPGSTVGGETMLVDELVATGLVNPIYSINFRPDGKGLDKAHAWVVYDDGLG